MINKDVVIIGAGPVGLFSVFQCGLLRLSSVVVDILPHIGGQLSALYPQKPIYDIPGCPNILAQDLIGNLEQQIQPFKPEFILGVRVVACDENADGFALTLSDNTKIQAKTIMIAAGSGAFGYNKPPLANIDEFEGKSVHYFVRETKRFAKKRVVIGGGGDSALDWAIALQPIAQSVAIVHRRAEFRAAPDSVAKMQELVAQGKIQLHTPYQVSGLIAQDGYLNALTLKDMENATKNIECDDFIALYGLINSMGAIKEWGLDCTARGLIPVHHGTMMTKRKGIFAVGDCAIYEGKLKLILQGFSDCAVASHAVYAICRGESAHFEHSTTLGLPKD